MEALSASRENAAQQWQMSLEAAKCARQLVFQVPSTLSLSPSLPLPFCSPCARVTEKCTCLTESTNARQTSDSAHLEYT